MIVVVVMVVLVRSTKRECDNNDGCERSQCVPTVGVLHDVCLSRGTTSNHSSHQIDPLLNFIFFRYIRPRSLAELNANIASGMWTRADLYVAVGAPSSTSSSSPFAFSTEAADEEGGVVLTGTATTLRVRYLPSSTPALGFTNSGSVLVAQIAATRRVSTVPIIVRYLDACGVDADGVAIQDSPCTGNRACVSSFVDGAWGYTCVPGEGKGKGKDNGKAGAGAAETDAGTVGSYVGYVLAVVMLVIIVAALYLRRQKKKHVEWDSDESRKKRLPTYVHISSRLDAFSLAMSPTIQFPMPIRPLAQQTVL